MWRCRRVNVMIDLVCSMNLTLYFVEVNLQANSTITRLDVSFALVENGDAYAAAVAEALSRGCNHLTTLLMRSNRLGDPAAVALAAMLQVHRTRQLCVYVWANCCVACADDGISALAHGGVRCQVNDTLTALDVMGNDIGDVGVGALAAALPDTGTLLLLNLSHNRFGWPGVATVASMLPHNRTLQHLSISGPYEDNPIEPVDSVDKLLAALQVRQEGKKKRQYEL